MMTFKYLIFGTPNDGSSNDAVNITYGTSQNNMATLKNANVYAWQRATYEKYVKVCQTEPLEYLIVRSGR
jgi:hypothetical protein